MITYFLKNRKKIHYILLGGLLLIQLLLILLIVNESRLNEIDLKIYNNTNNTLKVRKAYIELLKSQSIFKNFLLPNQNFNFKEYSTSLNNFRLELNAIKEDSVSTEFKSQLKNKDSLYFKESELKNIIDSINNSDYITLFNKNLNKIGSNDNEELNSIKVSSSTEVESLKKKGLLGRLGDAISGKTEIQKEKEQVVVTMKYGNKNIKEPIENQSKNEAKDANNYYAKNSNNFSKLSNQLKPYISWNNKIIAVGEELISEYESTIFDFEKYLKKQYNQQKFKNKIILYSIIVTVMLLIFISIVYFTWYAYNSEQRLKQANATKQKFFSIISHDLINPFNALLGFTQLLNDDYDTLNNTKKKEFIGIINNAAKQNYNLVSNLLKWSKTQQNNITPTLHTFNLKTMVQQSLEPYLPLAQNKFIAVTIDIDESLSIHSDKNIISTCIINIVSNAIKFTKQHGCITISSGFAKPNKMHINIKDNGVGMTQAQINKLFLVDKATSSKGTNQEKGSGLGLIICKELIALLHGDIKVKSNVDKGTEVTLVLPI